MLDKLTPEFAIEDIVPEVRPSLHEQIRLNMIKAQKAFLREAYEKGFTGAEIELQPDRIAMKANYSGRVVYKP